MKLSIQKIRWVVLILLLFTGVLTNAKIQSVDMKLKLEPARLQWNDKGVVIEVKGHKELEMQLARLREAQVRGDWKTCLQRVKPLVSSVPLIAPWLNLVDLDCSINSVKNKKGEVERLRAAVTRTESHTDWLLTPPYADLHRKRLKEAYFELIEADLAKTPTRVLPLVEKLLERDSWLNNSERAKALKFAGEAAFTQQNMKAARGFFARSVQQEENSEVKQRLKALDVLIGVSPDSNQPSPAPKKEVIAKDERLEASKPELDLFDRVSTSLKGGETVSAVEDAITLMGNFPGGVRASWAQDRVYEALSQVAEKDDKKFVLLKERILGLMKKAEGPRLQAWAQSAFKAEDYEDAFVLSKEAVEKLANLAPTKLLYLNARSAYFIDKLGPAREMFQVIVDKHSGTEEAVEALFNLGLLSLRQGDAATAAALLERLLVVPRTSSLEIRARYWLWRALQTVDPNRAAAEAQNLIARYPLTYYGLKARFETKGPIGSFPDGPKIETQSSQWMFDRESSSWKRLVLLLGAGWYDEARLEFLQMPEPQDLKGRIFYAQLSAMVMDFPKAISLLNKVWDEDPNFLNQQLVKVAFPKEYNDLITEEATNRKVEPSLVRALIRQESGYNAKALSSSGALGLMQMIPPTAQEVAQELRFKGLKLPDDLLQPKVNVRFCTYYLSRLISQFDGNVPMALAAYNAGPARLKRWFKNRKISTRPATSSQDEIWFDEMPWTETQGYVKAILRNLVVYRMLDRGRAQVSNSFWNQPIP